MSKIPQEQGSSEWLEFRRSHIGASDLPIILGVAPKQWGTPYILWQRKLKFITDIQDNFAMKIGRDLEPIVRELVILETGIFFRPQTMVHKELEWASASLDGINEKEKLILEIKCPNKEDHKKAKKGKIPEKYIPQVQWQIFVSGLCHGKYASYHNEDLQIVDFEIDEEYITNTLLPAAKDFYRCLVEYDAPELQEGDYTEITDKKFIKIAKEWVENNRNLKELTETDKFLKNMLTAFTDDGNCCGGGIKLTRVKREGSVDWNLLIDDIEKKFPKVKEEINIEDYRKDQIGYWKITASKV